MTNQINVNNSERFYVSGNFSVYTLTAPQNFPKLTTGAIKFSPNINNPLQSSIFYDYAQYPYFLVLEPGIYAITVTISSSVGLPKDRPFLSTMLLAGKISGENRRLMYRGVFQQVQNTPPNSNTSSILTYTGFFDTGDNFGVYADNQSSVQLSILRPTTLTWNKIY